MDGYTTVLCYTSSEIIDCEFGVCYNRPLEKCVSINNMITFNELETKLCHALNINRTYTKLNMVFDIQFSFQMEGVLLIMSLCLFGMMVM